MENETGGLGMERDESFFRVIPIGNGWCRHYATEAGCHQDLLL